MTFVMDTTAFLVTPQAVCFKLTAQIDRQTDGQTKGKQLLLF